MFIDWLKSFRGSYRHSRRRFGGQLSSPVVLEPRTLLSGAAVGVEFPINSWTSGSQSHPAVGVDADGDYIVTWQSKEQDGSLYGIYAQRYNKYGEPVGSEFRVNSTTSGDQRSPSVAMDSNGNFVITWQQNTEYQYPPGPNPGIYAQIYNALGVPQGSEFLVNSSTRTSPSNASIEMDADGDFVITWQSIGDGSSYGIYAQRYNAAGVAQGSEFQVNSWFTGNQRFPSIGIDADGDFVITWQSYGQDGHEDGIYAQRYNAAGIAQGSEFRVNTRTLYDQDRPVIAMDADGDFIIAWESKWQDGSEYGIYAQRYNAAGVAQGSEFRVNTWTTSYQNRPAIAMGVEGDFIITWQSRYQDGDTDGVYAQRYSALGVARGSEFRINTKTWGWQASASIGMDAEGDLIIAWDSGDQDGSGSGIYAKWFRTHNVAPVLNNAGTPTLDPLTQNQSLLSNTGTRISDIIARMGASGGITDTDRDPVGIAIYDLSATDGSWQFTANGGWNWIPITPPSHGNALLLAADPNMRIRFIPNAGFVGQARFRFVAWDRSSGANGGIANIETRGGTTPFSVGEELATIAVNNSAPVLHNSGTPTLDPIPMNVPDAANPGTRVSDIIARMGASWRFSDPNPGALQGIAINGLGNTATGDWQYTTDGGATWQSIGTTGNSDARLLAADPNTRVRYVPQVGYLGTAIFSFVAWDQTRGSHGGTANVNNRGGTTPYSLDYELVTIDVFNSAPVLNNAGNPKLDPILTNVYGINNTGILVGDLIVRMGPTGGITDPNVAALRGIAVNGLGNTATGDWQFSTNGGTTWRLIGTTGNGNARLLAADANTRVRYVPQIGYRGAASFSFVAWDRTGGTNGGLANVNNRGGRTPFSAAYDLASIKIDNAAPILNNAGTPQLDPIPMNVYGVNNVGTSISDLIARMKPAGGIADANPGALQGIAVNGLGNTATGDWQYTINGGASWQSMAVTGNSNARLLASEPNTRIRYVPQVGYLGTAIFSFVAWDQTGGSNGGMAAVGGRGGTTPYSLDYDFASISIVNSAPVLNDNGNPTFDSITNTLPIYSNLGVLVSTLISRMGPAGGITDANNNSPRGIAVIGKSGLGTWEYSINNWATWFTLTSTSASNATLLASDAGTRIRFRPTTDFVGEAKIAFVGWDQTTGTNGTVVDASTRGGATALSLDFDYALITVTA